MKEDLPQARHKLGLVLQGFLKEREESLKEAAALSALRKKDAAALSALREEIKLVRKENKSLREMSKSRHCERCYLDEDSKMSMKTRSKRRKNNYYYNRSFCNIQIHPSTVCYIVTHFATLKFMQIVIVI